MSPEVSPMPVATPTAQARTPSGDPALWIQAQRMVSAGDWQAAQECLDELLRRHSHAVNIRVLAASVCLARGQLRVACNHLAQAASALPADIAAICKVAQALAKLGETNSVRACLGHPEIARTRDAPGLLALAHLQQGLGLHAEALALMERARALGLSGADFRYFRALQLQFNGRLSEAEAEMETCLAEGPTYGRASLSLARVRRQTSSNNHIDQIRERLKSVQAGSEDHAAFEFALHKELDDIGCHEDAWYALERGNEVMHTRLAHDSDAEEALFQKLIDTFAQPFEVPATQQSPGPTPIFIVGMPRSGTTLLERIVGNHSEVTPTGELTDFPRQLRWTANRHGHALLDLELLTAAPELDYAMLGRRYLQQTQWRAQGRRFYVDKLPPNFMLIGFIRRALPQAKILHMVRDPMDVCFSNYRALFGDSYGYSYRLEDLARHYHQYRRLMRHWHRVAPGFVFDISYDDLVRNAERSAREVLEFCELAYEDQCTATTSNTAPVATLSSAQVRSPIHQRSLGEWRRYEAQLESLRLALAETNP